jgi:hypothetical protein
MMWALLIAGFVLERATALRFTHRRVAMGVSVLPALVVWIAHPGVPTTSSVLDVLFCTTHGMLATSALLWLGAAGLCAQLFRRGSTDRWIALSFALTVLAIAGGHRTDETWSEAMGRAAVAVPFLGVGLAQLYTTLTVLSARRPIRTVAAGVGVLVIWSLTLTATAENGTLRIGEVVSFGDVGAAQAQVLHGWIGHPLSAPANLWFALRNRVSPARYDGVMSAHVSPTHDVTIDIGAADDAFVVDGWHGKEQTQTETFRWTQQEVTMLLPPVPAGQARIRIRLQPFVYQEFSGQSVDLQLGSERCGRVRLVSGWQWVEWNVPATVLGGRPIRASLIFDHATRPADVAGGTDQRLLSASIDLVEIRVGR